MNDIVLVSRHWINIKTSMEIHTHITQELEDIPFKESGRSVGPVWSIFAYIVHHPTAYYVTATATLQLAGP